MTTAEPPAGDIVGGTDPTAGAVARRASLRLATERDREDCLMFLGRLIRLDGGPVRLTATPEGATMWARPLGVLLRRDVRGALDLPDRTVDATELLTQVEKGAAVTLPAERNGDWRATLPPPVGWRLLDSVPTAALSALLAQTARLVRAAADPGRAGDSLLQQDAMTVSDDQDEVTVGLREVTVLHRLGLLAGPTSGESVRVGVTPAWIRVAARHGTVYRRRAAALGLT